jgi:hypothetical protein
MKKTVFLFTLALFTIFSMQLHAQSTNPQANYIISIGRNVQWPESMSQNTIKIAVYGSFNQYKVLIGELMDKSIYNKNIEVYNLVRFDDLSLINYHMVFIANSACNESTVEQVRGLAKGSLIITEKEGSLEYGSVINFIKRDQKLHFEISEENARTQGLKVTANLLHLAHNTRR